MDVGTSPIGSVVMSQHRSGKGLVTGVFYNNGTVKQYLMKHSEYFKI
jgi:hypothetical protein